MKMTQAEYIRESVEANMFFARIMKEHAFFIKAGLTPKEKQLAQDADGFREAFDAILYGAIALSGGTVSAGTLRAGDFVTPYTLQAETISSYFTGIPVNTALTQTEAGLKGSMNTHMSNTYGQADPVVLNNVYMLNQNALGLVSSFIQFKAKILSDVAACIIFTSIYPLMLDHIIREAEHYQAELYSLQERQNMHTIENAPKTELFWNNIMKEHAEFQRGLLDPSEKQLQMKAEQIAHSYENISGGRENANINERMDSLTAQSIAATRVARQFNLEGTQGAVSCRVRSIIIPLLADHVLRESNHYMHHLQQFAMQNR